MVLQDFYCGDAFDAYLYFGAHPQPCGGVMFRVYAPNAAFIEVTGEFNDWNGFLMDKEGTSGVHSAYVSCAEIGQLYKYRIHAKDGRVFDKIDPFAFASEHTPEIASVITDLHSFEFSDREWISSRSKCYNEPMNIYEVQLGSWKKNDGAYYTYKELASLLIEYVKKHHFTHIELMPTAEYPNDASWGYQVTGFFSPTSRYGTPDDLKYLINECHKAGIGVITDFVLVHFAVDSFALVEFDGTALYEYPNAGAGISEWGSYNFNFYRGEVRCFIQSAANYWLEEFHFDGIRMDAVSNIIYWQGEPARGTNNGAVNFIRAMNSGLHHLHPNIILMAEDSSNYLKVTAPVEYNGLGFDYKWDMGWMNDTLNFFRTPPYERKYHYNEITFSMQYFYNELYILPLSHDEVVHGKATIIQKMWGDYDVKFSQCRALFAYMFTHPGKKLNFMGNEFAQFREWDEKREQDWDLPSYPLHAASRRYISDLALLYCNNQALFNEEYNSLCFTWLEANAPDDCVYIYKRSSGGKSVITALNLSDKLYKDYTIGIDIMGYVTELINSDSEIYSGATPAAAASPIYIEKKRYKAMPYSFRDTLPPFSAKIYELTADSKK